MQEKESLLKHRIELREFLFGLFIKVECWENLESYSCRDRLVQALPSSGVLLHWGMSASKDDAPSFFLGAF